MKIRALKKFEGIKDNERNVFPKAGDVWEVSEERAEFLKSHGVIEFVEEDEVSEEVVQAVASAIVEEVKENSKEEVELNEFGNPVGTRELKEEKPKTTKKKKSSKK